MKAFLTKVCGITMQRENACGSVERRDTLVFVIVHNCSAAQTTD